MMNFRTTRLVQDKGNGLLFIQDITEFFVSRETRSYVTVSDAEWPSLPGAASEVPPGDLTFLGVSPPNKEEKPTQQPTKPAVEHTNKR